MFTLAFDATPYLFVSLMLITSAFAGGTLLQRWGAQGKDLEGFYGPVFPLALLTMYFYGESQALAAIGSTIVLVIVGGLAGVALRQLNRDALVRWGMGIAGVANCVALVAFDFHAFAGLAAVAVFAAWGAALGLGEPDLYVDENAKTSTL